MAAGGSRIAGRPGRLCWLTAVSSLMGKSASLRIKTPTICSSGTAPVIAAMHTPCFWWEERRTCVTMAVGDSLGQMPQCQKDSASLPARLPSEGSRSRWTKPPLTQRAGEEATPASCHTTVCTRFSHLGAGSRLQQTVRRSTCAFNTPHLLLNTVLV